MAEASVTIQTAVREGASARYDIDGRVVRVHEIRWSDGRQLPFDPPVDLGVALALMPRPLWESLHRISGEGTRNP
ncbi:hypothetical protein ACWEVD_00500 [Nocardia thailandica]